MGPPKILIVDDDLIIRSLLRHTLGSEAYLLFEAENGQQAMEIVQRELPDLILLDVMMPVMNGIAVLRRLQADERTRQIPVIIITALTDEKDVATSLEAGAIDHITKPFSELIVRTRVKAVLRNRMTAAGEDAAAKRGRRIGFLGAKGGVGVTTAVVNTALSMSAPERSVAVLELHAWPGTLAQQLGVPPALHLEPLLGDLTGGLTSERVASCLQPHTSGLQLLLGPPTANLGREIAPERARALLDTLAARFDFVLADLESLPAPATRAAVRSCDYIILVVELEATCLALARGTVDAILACQVEPHRLGAAILLHHASAGTFVTVGSARNHLPCPIIGVIPPCGDQNLLALKNGVPIVHSKPDCAASVAFTELGARLMAERISPLTF